MAAIVKKFIKLMLIASFLCLIAWICLSRAWGEEAKPIPIAPVPSLSGDPYALLFQVLAIVLITAAVGHFIAGKLRQSAVMGEIVMGIVVGSLLYQLGGPTITVIRHYEQVNEITTTALQTTVCFIPAGTPW